MSFGRSVPRALVDLVILAWSADLPGSARSEPPRARQAWGRGSAGHGGAVAGDGQAGQVAGVYGAQGPRGSEHRSGGHVARLLDVQFAEDLEQAGGQRGVGRSRAMVDPPIILGEAAFAPASAGPAVDGSTMGHALRELVVGRDCSGPPNPVLS